MNKRKVKTILTTLLAGLILAVSSCGGDAPSGHTHVWSTSWSSDETYHWHDCEVEGCTVRGSEEFHKFGEWIIDVPATEEHDGTRHHVCEICGYSHSESYKHETLKPAERVYIANVAPELFNGYTYSLSPVVVPYDANKNIKYEVERPELMSVTDNVALATGVGSTLLYVYNDEDDDNIRDEDEAFTVMSFTLSNPEAGKSVNVQESITIKVDESKKLTYSQTGIDAYGMEYGFYSEDQSICTIAEGKVKGHRPGTTRVSVSLKGYRAYCNVTVENLVDQTGIRAYDIIPEDDFVINKGETKTIAYNILPSNSVDTLKYVETNNEAVVKVNADKTITALKGGTARIKLTTTNGKYSFVLVTVKDNANLASSYYNNYYGNLTWDNSEDLISKLHTIISKGVTPLKYGTPNWESNQMADQSLYDHSYVDCVYIDSDLPKTDTNSGWQREHAFAASLMAGYSTSVATGQLGRATDFHNLFAAGGGANGSRGNKNLGYARVGSQEIETKENCVYDKKTFEPADEDKGRLARALMYMTVMYNGENDVSFSESSKKVNFNQQSLELTSENVDYSKITINEFLSPSAAKEPIVNYYRSLVASESSQLDPDSEEFKIKAFERYMEQSMPYAIGNAEDIIEWGSFPVNYVEYQHNNSVYSDYSAGGKGTQGNRNPFVDYPQLIEYAFGELKNESGSLNELTPSYLILEMDKDEIHHYAVESETIPAFESGTKPTVDDFNIKAIKNNLTEGTLDKSKISVEDYTFTDDDVENGKEIKIYTDKNTLKVPCKVTSESVIAFDTCTWNHIDDSSSGHNKDCYGSWTGTVANNASFSGLDFVVTLGNEAVVTGNKITNSKTNGTKFGTADIAPQSLTFETKNIVNIDDKTKVNAVFFIASTASGCSYKYKIYIGDNVIESGSFTGSNIEKSVILSSGNELTGKVKIEFTDINKAINIRGLAINAIA